MTAGKHLVTGPDALPSAQKSILASCKRPAIAPSAMPAASAVKPPRKGGVKWADDTNPADQPSSDRCPSQHLLIAAAKQCRSLSLHALSIIRYGGAVFWN